MTYLDVGDLIYGLIWMEDVAGKQSAGVYCPSLISVCGSEILAKKFNIQKVVVYVTDLDEKLICQYRILRSTRTNGQIEDWNKK